MTTMLEKTLEQIDGSGRSEYHALVFESVENPAAPCDAERVRGILLACGKTAQQLLADVARVRDRFEADATLKRAAQAAEAAPALEARTEAAEKRFAEIQTEMLRKLAVEANEATKCKGEAHQLRMAVLRARQQLSQILAATAARSVRGRLTPEQCSDWKAIDLFASDDPPCSTEVYKPNQQPPSTRNARPGAMSGSGYD